MLDFLFCDKILNVLLMGGSIYFGSKVKDFWSLSRGSIVQGQWYGFSFVNRQENREKEGLGKWRICLFPSVRPHLPMFSAPSKIAAPAGDLGFSTRHFISICNMSTGPRLIINLLRYILHRQLLPTPSCWPFSTPSFPSHHPVLFTLLKAVSIFHL